MRSLLLYFLLTLPAFGLTIGTPDFSTSGQVQFTWSGHTNQVLDLEASGDLVTWRVLQTVVTSETSGLFTVPLSDLAGLGYWVTNITEEFHGYTWVTGMDFVQRYVWVDTYAGTNITFYSQGFFRLNSRNNVMEKFVIFTCGFFVVTAIWQSFRR